MIWKYCIVFFFFRVLCIFAFCLVRSFLPSFTRSLARSISVRLCIVFILTQNDRSKWAASCMKMPKEQKEMSSPLPSQPLSRQRFATMDRNVVKQIKTDIFNVEKCCLHDISVWMCVRANAAHECAYLMMIHDNTMKHAHIYIACERLFLHDIRYHFFVSHMYADPMSYFIETESERVFAHKHYSNSATIAVAHFHTYSFLRLNNTEKYKYIDETGTFSSNVAVVIVHFFLCIYLSPFVSVSVSFSFIHISFLLRIFFRFLRLLPWAYLWLIAKRLPYLYEYTQMRATTKSNANNTHTKTKDYKRNDDDIVIIIIIIIVVNIRYCCLWFLRSEQIQSELRLPCPAG